MMETKEKRTKQNSERPSWWLLRLGRDVLTVEVSPKKQVVPATA